MKGQFTRYPYTMEATAVVAPKANIGLAFIIGVIITRKIPRRSNRGTCRRS